MKVIKRSARIDHISRKKKSGLTSWEEQMVEESKDATKRHEQKIESNEVEWYIQQLNELWFKEHNYSGIVGLIIKWGTELGFKNMVIENWVAADINNFIKMIYNKWLSLQPGCSSRLRSKWNKSTHARILDQEVNAINKIADEIIKTGINLDDVDFKQIANQIDNKELGSGRLKQEVKKEIIIRSFCQSIK